MARGSNYGVEIEFSGISRRDAVNVIRRQAMIDVQDDGYHHDRRDYWRITSDGSVVSTPDGDDGNELVSPVMSIGKPSFHTTGTIVRALSNAGGMVDRSCGLHVHHNVSPKHTKERLINMMHAYCAGQREIDSIMPRSRSNASYARHMSHDEIAAVETREMRARDYYYGWGGLDRYYVINPASVPVHGSMEFRQHSGTLNGEKITHWVLMTRAFMNIDHHWSVFDNALKAARDSGKEDAGLKVLMSLLGLPDATRRFYLDRRAKFARESGARPDTEDSMCEEYAEPQYEDDDDRSDWPSSMSDYRWPFAFNWPFMDSDDSMTGCEFCAAIYNATGTNDPCSGYGRGHFNEYCNYERNW